MKKPTLFLFGLAVLLAGAFLLKDTIAQTATKAAPAAPRVAVCDVVEVFNSYQRAKELDAKLKERKQAIKNENDARGKKIDSLQMELEGLKEGSKEYEDRFSEVQRLTLERQAWLDFQERVALRDHYRLTKEMYTEILKMVAAVGKEQGYHIVLYRESEGFDTGSTPELLRAMERRKVLYNDESVDLTATVLARLNEAWRKDKKG